jgi:drug/metabolite transporter (DMT)-like permease
MSAILGVLAAVFYGAADFCGGLATKRTPVFSVAIVSQAVGFGLLLVILIVVPQHATLADELWGLAAGACGGLGLALLYHALSIGKMGVVSPITAVLAASLPLGVGTLGGEHLATLQIVGVIAALSAVVLISLSTEESGTREIATSGVREAIASGIVLGGFYLFLGLARPQAGLAPLVTARAASIGFLLLVALIARSSVIPRKGTFALIALSGALDMTANALYLFARYAGYLSIAAVLTSLYPASTVFLAGIVLRERLRPMQWVGVGLALGGVALISI